MTRRPTAARPARRERKRERAHRTEDERGAATVVAVALLGVLLLIGGALGVVAALVVDHRTAQAAADLAALAAAQGLATGEDGCAAASRIASANGARLTACALEGRDARVAVLVSGPRWLGQTGDLAAEARAGPGSSVP